MRVAVVVPVLNEARVARPLAERLRDLPAEVVVIDGGSHDATREILSREGLRVLDSPRGRARQMNAGARATNAPVILFLHADTRLPPGAIDSAARAVERGAIGGCFRLRIDSDDPRLRLAARLINLRSALLPSASGDQAIFVARAAFDAMGGYREIALCEDLDLVRRMRRRGRFLLCDDEVETSARRWESNGVLYTIALMWTLRLGYHLGVDPTLLGRIYGQDVR